MVVVLFLLHYHNFLGVALIYFHTSICPYVRPSTGLAAIWLSQRRNRRLERSHMEGHASGGWREPGNCWSWQLLHKLARCGSVLRAPFMSWGCPARSRLFFLSLQVMSPVARIDKSKRLELCCTFRVVESGVRVGVGNWLGSPVVRALFMNWLFMNWGCPSIPGLPPGTRLFDEALQRSLFNAGTNKQKAAVNSSSTIRN